jgi:hypothetical protein
MGRSIDWEREDRERRAGGRRWIPVESASGESVGRARRSRGPSVSGRLPRVLGAYHDMGLLNLGIFGGNIIVGAIRPFWKLWFPSPLM